MTTTSTPEVTISTSSITSSHRVAALRMLEEELEASFIQEVVEAPISPAMEATLTMEVEVEVVSGPTNSQDKITTTRPDLDKLQR